MEIKKLYRCHYCGRHFPSRQGQRSHVAQAAKCKDKHAAMIASIRAPEYESEAAAGIDNASEDIPGMAQTNDIFPSPGWGDPIGLPNPDAMDAPNTHE